MCDGDGDQDGPDTSWGDPHHFSITLMADNAAPRVPEGSLDFGLVAPILSEQNLVNA